MRSFFVLALCLLVSPAAAHEVKHHATQAVFVDGRFTPPDADLIDRFDDRQNFMTEIAAGHRVVINFFYANCTEICPVTNLIMSMVAKKAFDLDGKPVRLVSITVDPQRDSPAVLNELAEAMGANENWIWLTGPTDEVRRLTHSLGMQYQRPEDHGILFIVGDPESGHFISTAGLPDPDELLAALKTFGN